MIKVPGLHKASDDTAFQGGIGEGSLGSPRGRSPGISGLLIFSPSKSSELTYVCVFIVTFRIFSCVSRKNGEKKISIFPEAILVFHILVFFDSLNFLTYKVEIIPTTWDCYKY